MPVGKAEASRSVISNAEVCEDRLKYRENLSIILMRDNGPRRSYRVRRGRFLAVLVAAACMRRHLVVFTARILRAAAKDAAQAAQAAAVLRTLSLATLA